MKLTLRSSQEDLRRYGATIEFTVKANYQVEGSSTSDPGPDIPTGTDSGAQYQLHLYLIVVMSGFYSLWW